MSELCAMMTHTYSITGMTCSGCEETVRDLLFRVPGVTSVKTDISKDEVAIEMQNHISTHTLQQAFKDHPTYELAEKDPSAGAGESWLVTYKPILIVFAYITAIAFLAEAERRFSWMHYSM